MIKEREKERGGYNERDKERETDRGSKRWIRKRLETDMGVFIDITNGRVIKIFVMQISKEKDRGER